MKTKLLLLFLMCFSFNNFAQSQYEFIVPETWEVDIWDTINLEWDNFSVVDYTFNNDCNPTVILSQSADPMTSTLVNGTLSNFTYNALTIVEVAQMWNSTTDEWDDLQKNEHTYNNGNYDLVLKTQIFNWVNNDWELTSQHIYTYDGSDRVSKLTSQTWDVVNMVWINSSEGRYTYTANDLVNTVTGYDWVNGMWEEDSLATSTYAGSLLTTHQRQKWDGAQWENNYFETYTYDGNNHLIESLETEWNDATMAYEDDRRETYTNNAQGYPTIIVSESNILGNWLNISRQRFAYPTCAFLSVFKAEIIDSIAVYPNPTNEKVTISVKHKTEYSITNIHGQLIAKGVLDQIDNNIDLSRFKSGLYFINLKQDNQIIIKKIIKK